MKKLILVLWILCFFSCANDDRTIEEVNAERLEAVLGGKEIDLIMIFWTDGDRTFNQTYEDPRYEIDGSFLIMFTGFSQHYYDLAKLRRITEREGARVDLDFE